MRTSMFVLAAITLALLPSMATAATRLTEQQVRNVCGKDLQSGGGNIGCTKKCGTSVCDYNCKGGKCEGGVVMLFRAEPLHPPITMRSLNYGNGDDGKPKAEFAD